MAKIGRKKGSRNKGYWFRKGRGWFSGDFVKLLDEKGYHIKDEAARAEAEQAYHRLMASEDKRRPVASTDTHTVREVCRLYLKEAKEKSANPTYVLRKRFLYDFCEGKTESGKKVHKGYGDLPANELIGLHVKEWLDAHNWTGSRRMAFQAIRRAIRYGMTLGIVKTYPLKGFPVDPARKRQAYFTEEVEAIIYQNASRALADAIRALIGTGCRPGEVAKLRKRHIETQNGKMVWRFKPNEHKTGSKTKRDRVVPVPSSIADLVRRRIKWQKGDVIFQNMRGRPWTPTGLKTAFARLREKLKSVGVKLNKDQTLYACRHTYAKRQLGKGITTNILAAQMGNSPQIAWDHYGKDWDLQADNSAILWSGID